MSEQAINIILGVSSVMALAVAWDHGLKPVLLDSFRQRLFQVRDQLFIEVAQGTGSFDDKAYGMLRSILNQSIRTANQMSIYHLLMLALFRKRLMVVEDDAMTLDEKFRRCARSMSDREAADLYMRTYQRMNALYFKRMVWSYFPVAAGILLVLLYQSRKARKWRRRTSASYLNGALSLSSRTGSGVPATV